MPVPVTTQSPAPTYSPARTVGSDDFPEATDGYRRELFAHCYRMTGSVHDAEDLVQETYLRAWRAYHSFEGRSSVRTWLYRIATNVCLTALEGRGRRPLPTGLGAPGSTAGDDARRARPRCRGSSRCPTRWSADPADPVVDRAGEHPARVRGRAAAPAGPAARGPDPARRAALAGRRGGRGARTPRRPRSTAALQRAHATLAKAQLTEDTVAEPSPRSSEAMLDRYVQAFWDKDIDAIVSMLTHDAIWEMPPFAGWYQGADNIGRLIDTQCPGGVHDMPMLRDPRQRAAGVRPLHAHRRTAHFEPFHLQVLTLGAGRGAARRGVLRAPAVPAVRAARAAARPQRLTAMTALPAVDDGAALLERAVGYTRGCLALVRARPAGPADPLRRLGPARAARAHGRLAGGVHRGGRGRRGRRRRRPRAARPPWSGSAPGPARCVAAWSRPVPAAVDRRRPPGADRPARRGRVARGRRARLGRLRRLRAAASAAAGAGPRPARDAAAAGHGRRPPGALRSRARRTGGGGGVHPAAGRAGPSYPTPLSRQSRAVQ